MKEHTQILKNEIRDLMYESQWNRNSDYALYADYIRKHLPEEKSSNYYNIMQNYKKYNIYSFKAVERARRAIQREAKQKGDIALLSDKQVEKWREENEQVYRREFSEKN